MTTINTTPNNSRPTENSGNKAPSQSMSLSQITTKLSSLSQGVGNTAAVAKNLLGTLSQNGGNSVLAGALSSLLQTDSSAAGFGSALAKLASQFGGTALADGGMLTGAQLPNVVQLVRVLGNDISKGQLQQSNSELFTTSAQLLSQLQKGNINGKTQQLLKEALSMLRANNQSNSLSPQPDQINKVLHQVRKELTNAQVDSSTTRQVVEFGARLHDQLVAEEATRQNNSWRVQQRHSGQQQGGGQQQQQEEQQEELAAIKASRSVGAPPAATPRFTGSVNVNSSQGTQAAPRSGAFSGDSVFSGGLQTLYLFMQMLSDQANTSYAAMEANSKQSADAQKMATLVDQVIAKLNAAGDNKAKEPLPQEVIDFINENHIEIKGVAYYDADGKWVAPTPGDKYDLADLNATKASLENTANRASDFVSQSQLQLQKMMQTYNVCVSLINSLQTMLADMNKTIAQGIR